jgi:hypothetical protein
MKCHWIIISLIRCRRRTDDIPMPNVAGKLWVGTRVRPATPGRALYARHYFPDRIVVAHCEDTPPFWANYRPTQ